MENTTITPCYAVLSISQIKSMLKIAKEQSRELYNGKVRGQSTVTVHCHADTDVRFRSNNGYVQCSGFTVRHEGKDVYLA